MATAYGVPMFVHIIAENRDDLEQIIESCGLWDNGPVTLTNEHGARLQALYVNAPGLIGGSMEEISELHDYPFPGDPVEHVAIQATEAARHLKVNRP